MRDVCADCGKTGPSWTSMNRGVLLCDECCTIHRNIGRHVSWVRSLHHGWWSPSLLMMVEALNKAGANNIWEHTLLDHGTTVPSCKPNPSDPVHSTKESFIKAKHEDLEFVLKPDQDPEGIEGLGAQLHAAARTPDLLTSLRLFAQGADPNFYHEEKGSTPLHVAARSGQLLQAELLVIQGADVDRKDSNGKTPEECALEAGHLALAERLKECKYHVIDRLLQYLCSRKTGSTSNLDVLKNDVLNSMDLHEANSEGRIKLQLLTNSQFEKLVADVYDEVDRRETERAWQLSHASHVPKSVTVSTSPFLPVHPELSSTRNQGRQKLARLTSRELNCLIYDILQDAKQRDTTVVPVVEEAKHPAHVVLQQSPLFPHRLKSDISDEEPLYDSVASDEDYAYTEKPGLETPLQGLQGSPEEAAKGELRRSLSSSQVTISRLQSQVRLLQETVADLMKENRELRDEILHSRSFSRGMETSAEPEADPVSDNRTSRAARPTSMYETREGLRYWAAKNPSKGDEARSGTQSLYHCQSYILTPELPRHEDVIRRTDQVTKRIKELWTAMKESDHKTFVPCAERIRVAVAELTAIFAQSPPDDLIRELGVSTVRLQIECATIQDCRPSVKAECLQQVRNCAYDIAKATKLIVMKYQNNC